MAELETREKLFNYLSKELEPFDNNYDRLVYPNIDKATILDLKRFHSLSNDVRIIYYRDISPDKSALLRFVISDIGISYRSAYKILFFESKIGSWDYTVKWEEINRYEKKSCTGRKPVQDFCVSGRNRCGSVSGGTVRMSERISTGKSSKKRSAAYNNTDTDFKECAPWNRNFPTTWFIRCRCCLMRKGSRGEIWSI